MTDRVLNAGIFLITLIIVVFCIFRTEHHWDLERSRKAFRFFTVQSNVLCAVGALLMCCFPEHEFAWIMKYIGTVAVTLTMLTVFLFLAPSIGPGGLKKLLAGREFFLHLITPLLALLSFCIFERRGMSFGIALLGMISIVYYGPLYLYRILYAPEEKRWDDFYGFNKGGKWPVAFAMMACGTFLICMGLMGIQNL